MNRVSNIHIKLWGVLFFLGVIFNVTVPGQVVLFPSHDTYVQGGINDTVNYGTSGEIRVRTGSTVDNWRKSLIKFDLTSFTGVLESAFLKITVDRAINFTPGNLDRADFYTITDDNWDETTINWKTAPAPVNYLFSQQFVRRSTADPDSTYQWAVTAYVNFELSGDKVITFYMVDDSLNNTDLRMFSKEATLGPGPSLILNESVIPVELSSFSADFINHMVVLNWSTATELNNEGFEIQKKSCDSEFNSIDFVKGNGTTSEQHSYSFTDRNLNRGNYSYRLKQVDLDGSFHYSQTVEVGVNLANEFALAQNFPNPFNPETKFYFSLNEDGYVTISIYNLLGQKIRTLLEAQMSSGMHGLIWDGLSDLGIEVPSGIYIARVEFNARSKAIKMQLLR